MRLTLWELLALMIFVYFFNLYIILNTSNVNFPIVICHVYTDFQPIKKIASEKFNRRIISIDIESQFIKEEHNKRVKYCTLLLYCYYNTKIEKNFVCSDNIMAINTLL